MAHVRDKEGHLIEGRSTITEGQAQHKEWWDNNKSPAIKLARALARQEVRNALSSQQQIALLDRRLGVGTGARKERARLSA